MTGDTIDLSEADFTILTYVDSTGCTGCKMKLPLWKEFLNTIDSTHDSDVQFLMVVDSSGIEELYHNLQCDGFDYLVYLDAGNKISKSNIFPEKIVLQTYLLDKSKKVMAIGNPLYSSKIASLYKGIIEGKMSVIAESGDFVSIRESRISFGNIHIGEALSRDVVFTNHSNDTVYINKVVSSCDCTELSLPQRYIPPKYDMKATVHFTGDTITGDFERTLHIYYSDYDYPTIITILGNIIQ